MRAASKNAIHLFSRVAQQTGTESLSALGASTKQGSEGQRGNDLKRFTAGERTERGRGGPDISARSTKTATMPLGASQDSSSGNAAPNGGRLSGLEVKRNRRYVKRKDDRTGRQKNPHLSSKARHQAVVMRCHLFMHNTPPVL